MTRRQSAASLSCLLLLWSSRAWAQSASEAADGGPPSAEAPSAPSPGSVGSPHSQVAYNRYCLSCHGVDGDGRGSSGRHLGSVATNFTTGVYKCRSTPAASLPTDADLARSIRNGLIGTAMPSFNTIGPLEQDDVRATIKAFSARFSTETPSTPLVIPPEPASDGASIARGLGVYQNLRCATCHGERGHHPPEGLNLHADDGSPASPSDLTDSYGYKCGNSNADVYRSLMTGLSGTPMSGYADSVSPEDAWDLVHYLRSLRR